MFVNIIITLQNNNYILESSSRVKSRDRKENR